MVSPQAYALRRRDGHTRKGRSLQPGDRHGRAADPPFARLPRIRRRYNALVSGRRLPRVQPQHARPVGRHGKIPRPQVPQRAHRRGHRAQAASARHTRACRRDSLRTLTPPACTNPDCGIF